MKIKTILIAATAALMSLTSFAQETKGKVSYDVYLSSDDPGISAYADRMEGSTLEIQFVDGKIRTDLYMGDMMTNTSVTHKDKDTTLVLLDGMMGKIAMKVTEDSMGEEERLAKEDMNVELIDETKEIMGYECRKAIITMQDAEESVIWYTEDILPNFRGGQYLSDKIPGMPLEMYSKFGQIDMKIVAYNFKSKVKKPNEVFSLEVPEGFTLRSPEEMKQMGGQ